MRMEEVKVEPASPMVGKRLGESGIGEHTSAKIVGIHGPDGQTRIDPSGTDTVSTVALQEGDSLIALGSEDQLNSLKEFAQQRV